MSEDEWRPALEVPGSKLVHYLLNVDHPKGGPKARFFLAFGFDPTQPETMAEALILTRPTPGASRTSRRTAPIAG
ncbi:DUF6883 domain-containing protein [Methylobacterium nonmethylotrophicum]|uniref:DUF6883 domain-containing protein n=1 Tax=Methylobacterium nonmethylotrophicum TaxID=1141884 RepID=UPI001FDF5A5E|nr:DUF6883 domain-containing protein [Methylobacterium nonmethylotrophicum]